nr:uncharacterized protein LOC110071851 [Pogona vitticeps]
MRAGAKDKGQTKLSPGEVRVASKNHWRFKEATVASHQVLSLPPSWKANRKAKEPEGRYSILFSKESETSHSVSAKQGEEGSSLLSEVSKPQNSGSLHRFSYCPSGDNDVLHYGSSKKMEEGSCSLPFLAYPTRDCLETQESQKEDAAGQGPFIKNDHYPSFWTTGGGDITKSQKRQLMEPVGIKQKAKQVKDLFKPLHSLFAGMKKHSTSKAFWDEESRMGESDFVPRETQFEASGEHSVFGWKDGFWRVGEGHESQNGEVTKRKCWPVPASWIGNCISCTERKNGGINKESQRLIGEKKMGSARRKGVFHLPWRKKRSPRTVVGEPSTVETPAGDDSVSRKDKEDVSTGAKEESIKAPFIHSGPSQAFGVTREAKAPGYEEGQHKQPVGEVHVGRASEKPLKEQLSGNTPSIHHRVSQGSRMTSGGENPRSKNQIMANSKGCHQPSNAGSADGNEKKRSSIIGRCTSIFSLCCMCVRVPKSPSGLHTRSRS